MKKIVELELVLEDKENNKVFSTYFQGPVQNDFVLENLFYKLTLRGENKDD